MIQILQQAIAQPQFQPRLIRASRALFEVLIHEDLIDFRYGMHLLHHPEIAIELADDLGDDLFRLEF
ncbi:hypothetical protein [Chitinimonas sp.]|uniref:hypothetical protein n=1 Tax=Chitinimonas sp. TaxID=1934313 RepID=UPI002F95589F